MMKRNIFLISACALIALTSCNKQEKELKEIDSLAVHVDSVLRANPVLTVEHKVMAEELIAEYREYVRSYPNDTLSPGFLMKSAMLFHVMPSYKEELDVLDQIVLQYPETIYAQQALATAARVSEDNLNDYDRARAYLTTMKEKYPESPYGVNIDLQIEYVGDPDGLLEAIMEKAGTPLDTTNAEASVDAVK